MARIYWDVLDCGGLTECCCRCPDFNIDRRRKHAQICLNIDLPSWRRNGLKNRVIECCETPAWCPLPKLEFPENATEIISVNPIFKFSPHCTPIIEARERERIISYIAENAYSKPDSLDLILPYKAWDELNKPLFEALKGADNDR